MAPKCPAAAPSGFASEASDAEADVSLRHPSSPSPSKTPPPPNPNHKSSSAAAPASAAEDSAAAGSDSGVAYDSDADHRPALPKAGAAASPLRRPRSPTPRSRSRTPSLDAASDSYGAASDANPRPRRRRPDENHLFDAARTYLGATMDPRATRQLSLAAARVKEPDGTVTGSGTIICMEPGCSCSFLYLC